MYILEKQYQNNMFRPFVAIIRFCPYQLKFHYTNRLTELWWLTLCIGVILIWFLWFHYENLTLLEKYVAILILESLALKLIYL